MIEGQVFTSGFIQQVGFWVPVLPEGKTVHTFTHEELVKLLEKTFNDGWEQARSRYEIPKTTCASSTPLQ